MVSWVVVGTRLLRVFIAGEEVGQSVGYAASLGDIIGTLGGATVSLTLGGGVSDGGSTLGAGSSV